MASISANGSSNSGELTCSATASDVDDHPAVPAITYEWSNAAGSLGSANPLQLDASMVSGSGRFFALRVRGDSMMEEGILEGDLVIVKEQVTVRDGDIVVALVDGEATVKFYFRERDRIRLQPAHPTMAPIFVERTSQLDIQGIVVGVWRQY